LDSSLWVHILLGLVREKPQKNATEMQEKPPALLAYEKKSQAGGRP